MATGDFLYQKLALKSWNLIVQKARHPKATAAYGGSAENRHLLPCFKGNLTFALVSLLIDI